MKMVTMPDGKKKPLYKVKHLLTKADEVMKMVTNAKTRITDSDKNKLNDEFKQTIIDSNFGYHWEGSKVYVEDMQPLKYEHAMAIASIARRMGGKFKNARVRISVEF